MISKRLELENRYFKIRLINGRPYTILLVEYGGGEQENDYLKGIFTTILITQPDFNFKIDSTFHKGVIYKDGTNESESLLEINPKSFD